jgi:hypothetical protein
MARGSRPARWLGAPSRSGRTTPPRDEDGLHRPHHGRDGVDQGEGQDQHRRSQLVPAEKLTVPLCRPALAAPTLLIYNDFLWVFIAMSSGDKRPVTSALADLQGQFVSNQNLVAVGAMIAAVPTLVVCILPQKQFIAGLSLGSSKG